jgi:hypothetical protein
LYSVFFRVDLLDNLKSIRAMRLMVEGTQAYGHTSPSSFPKGDLGEVCKTFIQCIRGFDVLGNKLRSAEVETVEKLDKLEHYLKQHYCAIPNHIEDRMKTRHPTTWASLVSLSADWTPASDMDDGLDPLWPSLDLPPKSGGREYRYWLA